MHSQTLIEKIEDNLRNFDRLPLREAATAFLNTLGYCSQRIGNNSIDRERFRRLKDDAEEAAKPSEKYCIDDWKKFHILMQVTDDEINEQMTNIRSLFQSGVIDNEPRSYIFVTMRLDGDTYTRTQLSDIARLINKQNPNIPIMVIFRYGAFLTLAIINRREHKQAQGQHVLEKVTLIKDINLNKSHAAHRIILADLSLQKLIENESVHNFDTLHRAWTGILDTEPLTREFYGKLHKWYQWAVTECRFPDKEKELQVIRLITRLLFIWFLKEKHFEGKHLVPLDLFEKDSAEKYLNNFDPEASDYYRAVLQNLFFATLNTRIDERCFSTNASAYRFDDLLRNPDAFLEHLKQVPFVNGGLFDYHVTQECFTDDANERQKLHVPAKLFFDAVDGIFPLFTHYKFTVEERTPIEQEVALDPELLGQVFENLLGVYNPETRKAASKRKVTGSYYTPHIIVEYMVNESLISYFLQKVPPYSLNTQPLAKRLRDLLAYEHKSDAHSISEEEIGPIIQAINELKIIDPAVGSGAFLMDVLNKLVLILQKLDSQNERWKQQQLQTASQILDPEGRRKAIEAIEEVFSEENHHNDYGRKLYLIQNCIYGVDIQPFAITIAKLRFFISLIIEQKSNKPSDDNYGIRSLPNLETKLVAANTLIGFKELHESELQLFLEGNTVKPLLRQIQELRGNYFSVDTPAGKQEYIEEDEKLRNLLESTLALHHEAWRIQAQNSIKEKVAKLPTKSARQQLLRKLQQGYRKREAKVNEGMAEAKRIAQWNAYDPNDAADFFEVEYMFGVEDGFDIAIGNPPYIRHSKIKHLKPALRIQFGDFFNSEADVSVYFYKRGADFLRDGGILTYICTNKFMRSGYGENIREFLTTHMSLQTLLDLGDTPIFKAAVDTCITLINKFSPDANHSLCAVTLRNVSDNFNLRNVFEDQSFPIELTNLSSDVWAVAPPDAQALLKKLKRTGNTLSDCVAGRLYRGIVTGCNDALVINADTRDRLIDEDAGSDELIKPLFHGGDISKWKTAATNKYIIAIASSANREWPWSKTNDESEAEVIFSEHYPVIFNHLNCYRDRLINRDDQGKFYWELRSCTYYTEFEEPKIVYPDITDSVCASYDTAETFSLQTAYILPTDDYSLLAILNSRLFEWYAKYKFQSLKDPWGNGSSRFIAQSMEHVPIADRTPTQKAELSQLVERILTDPEGKKVLELEKKIDELVYQLYGLSKTEVALINQTYRDAGMPV